ncbi:MAG: type II toxin-antitoxin system RelE/ParE family toxin [Oscillospiraceae bacterium]|nr:type II toxin-antitoxin system RelE/ParE family toxin [Oscillospiraceae bacterium]
MTWKIEYTEDAERDLDDIYEYYSSVRLETSFAAKLINKLLQAADSLETMPFRFPAYPNEPWKSNGLRTLYKHNYVILYLPDEAINVVSIIRIMYGGRDIDKHLI